MKLEQILGLRGIAILFVLFFHLNFDFFKGGYIGVDIFFVISGFLITKILFDDLKKNKSINIKRFFFRRFSRLIPSYILILILVLILGLLLFSNNDFESLLKSWIYSLTGSSNIYFWDTVSYWDYKAKYNPLIHTWSLSLEFQFYFIIVFIFFFGLSIHKNKNSIGIYLIAAFILSILIFYLYRHSISAIFYLLPFRLFEFLSGSIVYFIKKKNYHKFKDVFTLLGVAGIFYSAINFDQSTTAYPFIFIPVLSSCLILIPNNKCLLNFFFNNHLINFFGKISYTLYLVHWPLICYYKYFFNISNLNHYDQIILTSVILIISSFIFYYYEKPLQKRLNKRFEKKEKILTKKSIIFLILISIFLLSLSIIKKYNSSSVYENLDKNYFKIKDKIYKNSSQEILILGDSHAEHLLPGIDYFSKRENITFRFVKRKIVNSLDGQDIINSLFYLNQLENINKVINDKKNNILIISYRWDHIRTISRLFQKWNPSLDSEEIANLYIPKIYELIEKINDKFDKIIIIGSFPMPTQYMGIYNCLGRPTFFGNKNCKISKITKNSRINLRQNINKHINNKLNKNINFIDPFKIFCDEKSCKNIIEDKIMYIDDNHLSKDGSKFFIKNIFNKILKN